MTAEDDDDLPRGSRLLDRYTVIDCVASGGMATIHRAVDDRFDRVVCVKLLRLDLDGQSSTHGKISANAVFQHFLREARALSRLQHPNTLRIYDFGYLADGHRPFQVSEFLDGGNLRQHVRAEGPLRPEEVVAVLECITGAIAEAHEHQILHRDIKPSNILFSHVGGFLIPKLADFGIARTLRARRPRGDDPDDTGGPPNVGLFSPRWAAPEQLAGGAEGPETDVYALGLVAAYMLAGASPFDGGGLLDVFDERSRADDVVRRRLVDLGIVPALVPVLSRAIAANPATRTPTPGALLREVQGALGGLRGGLPRVPEAAILGEATPDAKPAARPRSVPAAATSSPALHPRAVPPSERRFQVTTVHEKVDLDLTGERGTPVRFRVSILPGRTGGFQIQIKGLSCFVSRYDATGSTRPTPALSATQDGTVDFVSTTRQPLARVTFAFGSPAQGGQGHVFHLPGGPLVVPSSHGAFAVALDLGPEREMVVLCKRA